MSEEVADTVISYPDGITDLNELRRAWIFVQLAHPESDAKGLIETCAAAERWIKDGIVTGAKLKAVQ